MSRYVEYDSLIADSYESDMWDRGTQRFNLRIVEVDDIENAPSIDIVRCKECKKAHLTYDEDCKYCDEWKDDDGNYIEVYHDGNHYCSYGVRKESE